MRLRAILSPLYNALTCYSLSFVLCAYVLFSPLYNAFMRYSLLLQCAILFFVQCIILSFVQRYAIFSPATSISGDQYI